MSDHRDDYWTEAVDNALADAGVTATTEQIAEIGGAMSGSHECYGMAFGDDVASANLAASKANELQALEAKLQAERDKVHCKECNGTGRLRTYGGTFMSDSECFKCRGEGRHAP